MKKRFMLYLFITIALTSSIITVFIGAYSKSVISENLENIKNDTALRLENQFIIYDNFLLMIESELKQKAKKALLNLSSGFSTYESTQKPSAEDLKILAAANGVDEIYFINKSGLVYNTSFKTDLNLNLMAITDFAPFLTSVFHKNEVVFHRLSNSTLTGAINLYGYYYPKDREYAIEVSLNVNDYLNKISPNFWQKTIKNIFHSQLKYVSYLKQIDIYAMNDKKIWSFINEGKAVTLNQEMLERIFKEKEVKLAHENFLTVYKAISFENKDNSWSPSQVILEMNFDYGAIDKFETQVIFYSFIVCIAIILLSFLISSKILNNYITKRIININDALKEVAGGNYSIVIKDEGDDEITEITSNVNEMSATIFKHVSSLEELMPICASCKKIRDDKGYWEQVESYFTRRSGIKFSHGMCPDCTKKYYPEYYNKKMAAAQKDERGEPQH
ncbi:MAG TPA: HAMP domain-containing protein [Candidatus Wallbacteria bacterium]|nr:MAG: HAMP domain protein [bacterium ADurb.Bin243]HPG56651.1 HAMP domain-containing protein [Candidatus Wallbacteria bacterium]